MQLCPLFYKKNYEIIIKLNNNASINKIRKQALEEVTYKIDIYNDINTIKLCTVYTLTSRDIVIQIINVKKVKKLRYKDH